MSFLIRSALCLSRILYGSKTVNTSRRRPYYVKFTTEMIKKTVTLIAGGVDSVLSKVKCKSALNSNIHCF